MLTLLFKRTNFNFSNSLALFNICYNVCLNCKFFEFNDLKNQIHLTTVSISLSF